MVGRDPSCCVMASGVDMSFQFVVADQFKDQWKHKGKQPGQVVRVCPDPLFILSH